MGRGFNFPPQGSPEALGERMLHANISRKEVDQSSDLGGLFLKERIEHLKSGYQHVDRAKRLSNRR